MRLTTYTDYTLRVLIYLALKFRSGQRSSIPEIATAYGISRNHLMKIVNDLSQRGLVETVRGRSGGTALARPPSTISIGEVVRLAEEDFAIVECHSIGWAGSCAVWQACNLNRGFKKAFDAFMAELDKMTLEDAVTSEALASSLLGLPGPAKRTIPLVPVNGASRNPSRGAVQSEVRSRTSQPARRRKTAPVTSK